MVDNIHKIINFLLKNYILHSFPTCMQNVLWDTHTISPVLHKLCKLVPVSSPLSQWGVWVHTITWYCCHILTAELHFDSETENTHTHTDRVSQHFLVQKFICKNGKWAQVYQDLCFYISQYSSNASCLSCACIPYGSQGLLFS